MYPMYIPFSCHIHNDSRTAFHRCEFDNAQIATLNTEGHSFKTLRFFQVIYDYVLTVLHLCL